MSVLDYVLNGLEQALEVERELGVRSVETDRALWPQPFERAASEPASKSASEPAPVPVPLQKTAAIRSSPRDKKRFDFIFLHDRPLSADGTEMMTKIITALGYTPESAPIVIDKPIPTAKMYVILGGRALKKFMPESVGEPGQWIKSPGGREVLVTYSPEYILRFGTVTPAVDQIKRRMWASLKALKQRFNQIQP